MYDIPKEKKTSIYRDYIYTLLDYLYNYVERLRPLMDLTEELESIEKDFSEQWENGR